MEVIKEVYFRFVILLVNVMEPPATFMTACPLIVFPPIHKTTLTF
jgi:hypothetical protein